jgi:hypothetical protein
MTGSAPPPDKDQDARIAAVAALLAPVPLTLVPTQPLWTDTSTHRVAPKSLY